MYNSKSSCTISTVHERQSDESFWFTHREESTDDHMAYSVDTYGGVVFESSSLPELVHEFHQRLRRSMDYLTNKGFDRGFWIRIETRLVDHICLCMKQFGFYIHNGRREFVMLAKWSNESRPDPIPPPSNHQVGVGCVILRRDGTILLVKERSGPASVAGGLWKLPTGLVEPSEELQRAAIREAHEETGIDCDFVGILSFRHSQGGNPTQGASSDLFFVCLLHVIDEAQEPVLQESEIKFSRWVHHAELHSITQCGEGTAARSLMESVRAVVSGENRMIIPGEKLPAWRRIGVEQNIYKPVANSTSTSYYPQRFDLCNHLKKFDKSIPRIELGTYCE